MKKRFLIAMSFIWIFSLVCVFNVSDDINASEMVSWGYEEIGITGFLEKLNNENTELEEIVIAVIDSGIDTDHEWFENRIIDGGANCLNKSGTCLPGGYEDDNGHGTHVSGIIAKGTPENVKILPIKVLDKAADGWMTDFVAAIEYVVSLKNQGMNIYAINFSISSEKQPVGSGWNKKYEEAFQHAYDAGILSVVAAGNDAADVATISPANLENVITVSALTQGESEPYFSSSFSNYGDTIDFAAPGDNIYSAQKGGGVRSMWGTSIAVPHITAAIALLYSKCPNCSKEVIEDVLKETADDYGDKGKDEYYGYGVINLTSAYERILKEQVYNIKVIKTGCGTVSSSDGFKIKNNEDTTLTFEPCDGYTIGRISIDNEVFISTELEDIIKNGYTLNNVTKDMTIIMNCRALAYKIVSSTHGNGNINIVGTKRAKHGTSKTYIFTPDQGYSVSKIIVDGRSLNTPELANAIENGYTFNDITENHSIEVFFDKIDEFKIGMTLQTNLGLENLPYIHKYGTEATITIPRKIGYKIFVITIDGKRLSGEELSSAIKNGYTFTNINASHSIKVLYSKIQSKEFPVTLYPLDELIERCVIKE